MSQFADRPFVAGSVFGIRSFRTRNDTELSGPVKGGVFGPDENVARCLKGYGGRLAGTLTFIGDSTTVGRPTAENIARAQKIYDEAMSLVPPKAQCPPEAWLGMTRMANHTAKMLTGVDLEAVVQQASAPIMVVNSPPKVESPPEHRPGMMGCSCGYYAYLDVTNNPHHNLHYGSVLGIIEGYGLVTCGDRGFRAEKARLRALIGIVGDRIELLDVRRPILPPDYSMFNFLDLDVEMPTIEVRTETLSIIDGVSYPEGTSAIPRPIVERYPVPIYPSVELALAEFPLTRVED